MLWATPVHLVVCTIDLQSRASRARYLKRARNTNQTRGQIVVAPALGQS